MLGRVYVVHHVHEMLDGEEDVKLIGVYSSHEMAEAAVSRARTKPGFVAVPDGFSIDPYELDKDHWTEGYVTYYPPDELIPQGDS